MTTSRRFGRIAFAKQSAFGTEATAPLFSAPILSGGLRPAKEWDDLPRIGSSLARLGRFPTGAFGTGTVRVLAHPEAIGLLIYQAAGAMSRSGSTHTFTMTDEYPFALTFWSSVGSVTEVGQTFKFGDAFISRMRWEANTRANVEVEIDVTSFTYHPLSAMPAVSGVGSVEEDDEPRFKYIDSEVLLDPATAPPTVEYTHAERIMFEIDRAPEYRYGPSLTPTLVVPDRLVNFDAGFIYDSTQGGWQYLLHEYVGSLTGTLPTQNTPEGSFKFTSGRHPADPTKFLRVQSNGYNWQYTVERPDAEAQPGILEEDVTGIVVAPDTAKGATGTTEVTITLVNDFAQDY